MLYRPKKSSVKVTENYLNGIILLKHAITKWIAPIYDIISNSESRVLQVIAENLRNDFLTKILEMIDGRINSDVSYQKNPQGMRNQRCYAIKAGWNGLLDVARQTYRESTNDVYDLVTQYSDELHLPIKAHFTPSQGYVLKVGSNELTDSGGLPMEFINVVKTKKTVTMTTLALMGLNERINESLTEVYLMSDRIVAELVSEIAQFAGALYKISGSNLRATRFVYQVKKIESIALLDLLTSFAFNAERQDYVRPEFTGTYAVKSGRHPVKERIVDLTGCQFIPNDVYCAAGSNVLVISGPNMSGKTTYLRMIVLLNIMGQMGSFVPADYASFRLHAQVFSRIGCDSVVEASASSFMSEMREAAFILQNICDDSLVVIDELGRGNSTFVLGQVRTDFWNRGTSHTDGVAISVAITEQLASTNAFTFIATHFSEVGDLLAKKLPNVVKLHLHVECVERGTSEVNINYKYVVQDGPSRMEDYGIVVARIARFPQSTIDDAIQIARKLERAIAAGSADADSEAEKQNARKEKARTSVYHRLVQAWLNSRLEEGALRAYLKDLQQELLAATQNGQDQPQ
ncbi:MutS protein msh4 [Entophlyctis sp. JEL0112]|nr:MutS protein msh4 [Entophlyctis sp. JEL0112]